VVFDLVGVTFMDAFAPGALIGRLYRITRSGGCMRLVVQARPGRLLKLTGTSEVFCTFDTPDRALHAPVPIGPHEAA
jgi:anti-anti-sigma factor